MTHLDGVEAPEGVREALLSEALAAQRVELARREVRPRHRREIAAEFDDVLGGVRTLGEGEAVVVHEALDMADLGGPLCGFRCCGEHDVEGAGVLWHASDRKRISEGVDTGAGGGGWVSESGIR